MEKFKKVDSEITLMHGDCLKEMDNIEDGSIDLILADPPYGTMNSVGDGTTGFGMKGKMAWDKDINIKKIFKHAKKALSCSGKMILFAQQPFTTEVIRNSTSSLKYSQTAIWKKDKFANALSVNKAMVSFYEDIVFFDMQTEIGIDHPLMSYAYEILNFINMPKVKILKKIGSGSIRFLRINQEEFAAPTYVVYKKMIDLFEIDEMSGFKSFEEIKKIDTEYKNENYSKRTFNLPPDKKYKSNVFEYPKDTLKLHPTQKPVLLLEDLIKTFSNKGNTVLDFTMGSGSTAIACINTGRHFIGIEMEKKYYDIAKERILNHQAQQKLF